MTSKSLTITTWLGPAGALVAAGALIFGMTGCNGCGSNTPAPITNAANGADPADANLATADGSQPTQVMGQSQAYTPQQSSETFSNGQQAPAPIVNGNSGYNEAQNYNTQPNGYYDNSQQGYNNSSADNYAQTDQAPPELPVYEQPPAPDDNDLWTPGYWGYANTGYYWVPGAWVSAPYVGALWTPGWWGFGSGHYRFNHGYWGRHIGYYGGINYGYGYVGTGYYGGYWNSDHFYYNRSVTRVSPRVTNVYERNVVVNNVRYTSETNNRVSYNGGRGGVNYQPRPYEVAAMHEQHVGPLPAQQQFHREAAENRGNFYSANNGRPAQVALAQPIRTERIAPPPEVNRGGFGRGPAPAQAGVAPNAAINQRNEEQQQRNVMEQGRNAQLQQQNQVEQQRNVMEQGRNAQLQQHNQLEQQHGVMEQQHNQQLQQNNQAAQQRGMMEQQHNQQLQQNNAMQQQRAVQMEQHNPVEQQQRNAMEQQHNQPQFQQHNPVAQPQPQRAPEQPRIQPQQQHTEQPRPQQMAPQQHFEQRAAPTPQPQQHMEAPRPAPAPHVEAPRAAPAPHAEAPHAEAPHAAPAGGGGHPEAGPHH